MPAVEGASLNDSLAGSARQMAVQLVKAAVEGHPVVPTSERLDSGRIGLGQRESTRRACCSRAARMRSFSGGGSESASKNRVASSRASATVS